MRGVLLEHHGRKGEYEVGYWVKMCCIPFGFARIVRRYIQDGQ